MASAVTSPRSALCALVTVCMVSGVLVFDVPLAAAASPVATAQGSCVMSWSKSGDNDASTKNWREKIWDWLPFTSGGAPPARAIVVSCVASPSDIAWLKSHMGGVQRMFFYSPTATSAYSFQTYGPLFLPATSGGVFCTNNTFWTTLKNAWYYLGQGESGSIVTFGCDAATSGVTDAQIRAMNRFKVGDGGLIFAIDRVDYVADGGFLPPEFNPDELPDWVEFHGCEGLTIKSADIRGDMFLGGEIIPMRVEARNPERPPAAQTVKVRQWTPSRVEPGPDGDAGKWSAVIATLAWPGEKNFNVTVDAKDIDSFNWNFLLECADGTSRFVAYDPSGEGGSRVVQPAFSLEDCFDKAHELGLDPTSWVPGLVDRLKCVGLWFITPPETMVSYVTMIREATVGGPVATMTELAIAPIRAARGFEGGKVNYITTGKGAITFPEIPLNGENLIRNSLILMAGFSLLSRWWKVIRWGFGISLPSPVAQGELDMLDLDRAPGSTEKLL